MSPKSSVHTRLMTDLQIVPFTKRGHILMVDIAPHDTAWLRMTPLKTRMITDDSAWQRMNSDGPRWTQMDPDEPIWTRMNPWWIFFLFDFSTIQREMNTFEKKKIFRVDFFFEKNSKFFSKFLENFFFQRNFYKSVQFTLKRREIE